METLCSEQDCDHVQIPETDTCACHIEVVDFKKMSAKRREEVIMIAAIENPRFEVDAGGNIRLLEEEENG
jgi:hypothetical protein